MQDVTDSWQCFAQMRMPCCTNQSSVAKAWKEFDDDGRMKDSSFRERVVDCAEGMKQHNRVAYNPHSNSHSLLPTVTLPEFAKFTAVMAPVADDLTNRYSGK